MGYLVPLVVVWLVVVARISMVRYPGTQRVLWLTLALLAFASTWRVKPVYEWTNRATGSIVGGSIVKLAFAVAACAGLRTLIATLPGRPTSRWVRREWIVAALVIGILAVPVLLSPPRQVSPAATTYAEFYDPTWRSLVHWLPYLAYLAWAMAGGLTLFGHYGLSAPYRRLATGLRLVAAGCALGFVYIVFKLAALIAWHVDVAAAPTWMKVAEGSVGSGVLAVCITLIAFGSAWEAVVARLSASHNAIWARWALWRLHPLWEAMVALYPLIVLDDGQASVRRPGFRVLRRVVEIHDGVLALERSVDPALLSAAKEQVERAGYVGDEAAAMVLAKVLYGAARSAPGPGSRLGLPTSGGTDLLSEVRWLAMVSKNYKKTTLMEEPTASRLMPAN